MNKVLVTTDLSAKSKAGVRFALQLARQTGCSLVFLHVIEITKPTSWSAKRYRRFADAKIASFGRRLSAFVDRISLDHGWEAGNHRFVADVGTNVVHLTISTARREKADLICLSTRGGGRIQKLFGTTAAGLLTRSTKPVIVVPPRYRIKPITTLFYASDFAALSKEMKVVKTFAAPLGAGIRVFHYDYLLQVSENMTRLLTRARKHEGPGVTFLFRRFEIDQPLSYHIQRDLLKEKPSLLVLFTKHDRKWYERLFLPRETAQLALNPPVPMLVFRKR